MQMIYKAFSLYFSKGGKKSVIHMGLYLFSIANTLLQLYTLKWFVDSISSYNREIREPLLKLFLLLCTYLVEYLLSYFLTIIEKEAAQTFSLNFSEGMFQKLQKIKYSYFEDMNTKDIFLRLEDSPQEKVKQAVFSCLHVGQIIISTLISVVVLFEVSNAIVLSFLLVILISAFFSIRGINVLNQLKGEQTHDERKMNYFNDLLINKSSVLELRVFNALPFVIRKIEGIKNTLINTLFHKSFKASFYYNISTILTTIWSIIAIIVCYLKVISHVLALGSFVVVLKIILSLMDSMEQISYGFTDAFQNLEIMKYYSKFMDLPEMDTQVKLPNAKNDYILVVENVDFQYPNTSKYTLKNISFEVKNKEKIAIVGANGAGKSTLVKLLCDFYKPTRGEISCNPLDISAVFQEYGKYCLTVKENVFLGDVNLSKNEKKIMKNLQQVKFDNTVISLEAQLGKIGIVKKSVVV